MTIHSETPQILTSGRLTLRSGQPTASVDLLSGPTTIRGTPGDDVLSAGDPEEGDFVLIGGAGRDQLYAGDGHGPTTMNRTTFVINRASDLVAGEIYQGDPQGDHFEVYFTSMVGNDIKADVSLVGITLTDVQQISGFSGTLTMTAGQLADFDVVRAGAIRLAGGGTVELAKFTNATDLYLADADTTLTFTAADVRHLRGYGTYVEYHTGVAAGFAVHGGMGDDAITAVAAGYEFNSQIRQLGVTLLGGGGDDSLTGADQDDVLIGGLGNDVLVGGGGVDRQYGGDGRDLFLIKDAADLASGEVYTGGVGADALVGRGARGQVDLTGVSLDGVERISGFSGGLVLGSGQLTGVRMINTGTVTLADEAFIDMRGAEFLSEKLVISSASGTRVLLALRNYDSAAEAASHQVKIIGGAGADDITLGMFGYVNQYEYRPPVTTVYGRDGNDTMNANHGGTLYGGEGDDVLSAGGYSFTNSLIVGGAGQDQLMANDNGHSSSVFGIERASDIVVGEVYKGNFQGDTRGGYFTSMVGASIKADVSLVGVTVQDVQVISGFSGTLTMTAGQLAGFDEVYAGAIRLAEGGTVQLARYVDARDLYLADADTTLTFTAADVQHLPGYGTYRSYNTGVAAGFTVHGGNGNDTITAQAAGEYFNTRITQLGVRLLGGGGDDVLTGARLHDVIDGGLGDDQVFGGRGRDLLRASDGLDTLTGGAGADVFQIGVQPGGSGDTIADFSGLDTTEAGDRIRIVDGATEGVYLGAGGFAASGVTEVRYAHGMMKIDFDGNGTADSSFFLTGMTLASQLTQGDFL